MKLATHKTAILLYSLSALAYLLLSYSVPRTNFPVVLALYSIAFACFIIGYYKLEISFKNLAIAAFSLRGLLIVATPEWSNDFYRFVWDGQVLWQGINPYLILPATNPDILENGSTLYQGMGAMNGSHYTCYPPLNQLSFLLAAILSPSSTFGAMLVLRLQILLADLGILWIGSKLLGFLKLPRKRIFLYLLNPFVILEFTVNLHFEGLMIFLLLLALYLLLQHKYLLSSLFFALSVSIKLIPLLFLPLFYKQLGIKKSMVYYLMTGVFSLLFFAPFYSEALIHNFMDSIHLYFQNFEFNASFYYIIREIGYQVKGYNIIHTVGKITPIIILLVVLAMAVFRKNKATRTLFTSLLFAIVFYYALATTVHPWYIALPLILSLFCNYRFPLLWSFVVILSYSAYSNAGFQENLYFIGFEYVLVYGYMVYELVVYNRKPVEQLDMV